ncbi:hypothetical protein GON09_005516 [Rhodococcus sp. B50]|nr:hypothetical protein [Rhodococcus sp. B50]
MANSRRKRVFECAPADRIDAVRHAMLALPPVPPSTGWRFSTRLARDHYIRLDANDYSVHPAVIGRRIEVAADLTRVRVRCEGTVVAGHRRAWARHQTISDPKHVTAAAALRRDRMSVVHQPAETEVQIRALSDYGTPGAIPAVGGREDLRMVDEVWTVGAGLRTQEGTCRGHDPGRDG